MFALKSLLGSYWLWLAVFAAGAGAGGYLMHGQVKDARAAAEAAQAQAKEAKGQAEELGKSLDLVLARQAQTDASLAARKRQEVALTAQLKELNSDLDRAFKDDPTSSAWGADCVPDAVADRLRLPKDPDCAP
ncbi:hypothetical protein D3C85_508330 [compost metagenome]